ncbi:MAG: DNRLRE domain-containing protein [Pseudomonadales bacterium]|nr:DNRLRE domain-containing protein [Pseudomonadales bacterium]
MITNSTTRIINLVFLWCLALGTQASTTDKNKETLTISSAIKAAATSSETTVIEVHFRNGENGYQGAEDTHIAKGSRHKNWGNLGSLNADGFSLRHTEFVTLLKWNIAKIPKDAEVIGASLTFKVFNWSNGTFHLIEALSEWSEQLATWDNTYSQQFEGRRVGSFSPVSTGTKIIELDEQGLALIQEWVRDPDSNNGFIIRSSGDTNGFDMHSSEYSTVYKRPKLTVFYR